MAPALEILTLMKYTEDEDVGFVHPEKESKGIHKKLANVRIIVFRNHRAAFSQDFEGVSRTENALEQTEGVVDRFLRYEGDAGVETEDGAVGPSYLAAPRTHLRRSSLATSS